MDWLKLALAAMFIAGVLYAPGYVALRLLRARGIVAWALAPLLTLGFMGGLGQIYDLVHLPYNLLTVTAGWAACLLVVAALARAGRRQAGRERAGGAHGLGPGQHRRSRAYLGDVSWLEASFGPGQKLLFVLAQAVGAYYTLGPIVAAMSAPAMPSQFHDAMFHYSGAAIEHYTGRAPLVNALNVLNEGVGGMSYYPNLWHSFVALFLDFGSVTFISNATLFMLVALVWPVSLAALGIVIWGSERGGTIAALVPLFAPLSVCFPTFITFLHSLYPNALAMCLWPAGLAAIWISSGRLFGRQGLGVNWLLCLVIVAGSLLQAHTSTVMGIALALLGAGLQGLARWRRERWVALPALLLVGAGLGISALFWSMPAVRARADMATDGSDLWRVTLAAFALGQPQIGDWLPVALAAACLAVGAVYLARCGQIQALATWASLGLIAISTKAHLPVLSDLTGVWYGAFERIVALSVPLSLLMVAGGMVGLARLVTGWIRMRALGAGLRAVVIGALAGAIIWTSGGQLWDSRQLWARISYDVTSMFHYPWLSQAELQGLIKLGQSLPAGAEVTGDPTSGVGLLYALTGRDTTFARLGPTGLSRQQDYLRLHFKDILRDPKVCQILAARKIEYFYQDQDGGAPGELPYPGYAGVDTAVGFELVGQADQAKLWRITACSSAPSASSAASSPSSQTSVLPSASSPASPSASASQE